MGARDTTQGHREALIAAITQERDRLVSRRSVLRRAIAGTAAVSALVLVPAASELIAQDADQAGSAFVDDVDVLSYALTLEHLMVTFFADGMSRIVPDDVPGDDSGEVLALLAEMAWHEESHVVALTELIGSLGGVAPAPQGYEFAYEDTEEFFEVALALKNTAVAAYAGAITAASDPAVVVALLSIHSVEARHSAYLGSLLRHHSPFPTAFDRALTRHEVEEITEVLITEGAPLPDVPGETVPPIVPTDPPPPTETPEPTEAPEPSETPQPSRPGGATPRPVR